MHPSDGRERFCRQACFWGSHGTILNSTIMLAKGDGKHWLTWAKNQNYGHLKANQPWIWRNYVLFKGLMWTTGKPNHHAPLEDSIKIPDRLMLWGCHDDIRKHQIVPMIIKSSSYIGWLSVRFSAAEADRHAARGAPQRHQCWAVPSPLLTGGMVRFGREVGWNLPKEHTT